MPSAPSTQLYPAVVDASTLGQKFTSDVFLPIAVEGQADNVGTAIAGTLYAVSRTDVADTLFGPASKLGAIVKDVINRGAGPVVAVASTKGTAPVLADRQTAWARLESDDTIRIRLTDSEAQADLVGLAQSCANADLINRKQFCVVGMPSGTSKAALLTAATAIAAATGPTGTTPGKRAVLVGPGVYDDLGALQGGSFLAAVVAGEIAKNADPSNDLDLWTLPLLTGIEKDAAGQDVFRVKVVAGAAVNDYEDLLQGGVSPVRTSRVPGGVMTTHLRTVWVTDTTMDALATRIILDQIFVDIRAGVLDRGFLREGNTASTRARIASFVLSLLQERSSWVAPVLQSDGSLGYNVGVTSSTDQRQVTISYGGQVVRGIQTIQVAGNLTITVP